MRMQRARAKWCRYRRSVVCLQRRWRWRWRIRRRQTAAAVSIQATVRCLLQRRRYGAGAAATRIQTAARSHLARTRYRNARHAVRTIQWTYIAWKTRSDLLKLQTGVILLRRLSSSATRFALNDVNAALQSDALMDFAARITTTTTSTKNTPPTTSFASPTTATATTNNDAEHTAMLREWHSARTAARNFSCIVIQSTYRGHLCRRALGDRVPARPRIRDSFGFLVSRRSEDASAVLQRAFRGHRCRNALRAIVYGATAIQSAYRGYRCRSTIVSLSEVRIACVSIQRVFRGHDCRRRRRRLVVLLQRRQRRADAEAAANAACLVIQCGFRCHRSRTALRRLREEATQQKATTAAVAIQKLHRGRRQRRAIGEKRDAVSVVQKVCRGRLERERFREQREACIAVQRVQRGRQGRRRALGLRAASCLSMQRMYRGHLGRMAFRRLRSCLVIQCGFRCYRSRVTLRDLREAVQQRKEIYAAVAIQKLHRGRRQRSALGEERAAASIFQRLYRGRRERKRLCDWQQACIMVQKVERGQQVRRALRLRAAVGQLIQRLYRGHRGRKAFQRRLSEQVALCAACLVIQCGFRCYRSRIAVRGLREATRRKVAIATANLVAKCEAAASGEVEALLRNGQAGASADWNMAVTGDCKLRLAQIALEARAWAQRADDTETTPLRTNQRVAHRGEPLDLDSEFLSSLAAGSDPGNPGNEHNVSGPEEPQQTGDTRLLFRHFGTEDDGEGGGDLISPIRPVPDGWDDFDLEE